LEPAQVFDKLFHGVLRLRTTVGVRHLQLAFGERLYLMWVFRHFEILPIQVLSGRACELIADLVARPRTSQPGAVFFSGQPVIGTVERMPQPGDAPPDGGPGKVQSSSPVAWSRR
jgi:hypothetical protein